MSIRCSECGADVGANRWFTGDTRARCPHCGADFDIIEQLGPQYWDKVPPRPAVPRPSRFRLNEMGKELAITWRWISGDTAGSFGSVVILGAAFFFFPSLFFIIDAPWFLKVAGVPLLLAALWLTYVMLVTMLNRTTVTVSPEWISIRHGPLPWKAGRTLPSKEIDQIFCESRPPPHLSMDSRNVYSVNALTRLQVRVRLLSGFRKMTESLFLEQTIEARLGIKDRPVRDELPRDVPLPGPDEEEDGDAAEDADADQGA